MGMDISLAYIEDKIYRDDYDEEFLLKCVKSLIEAVRNRDAELKRIYRLPGFSKSVLRRLEIQHGIVEE